MLESCHQLSNGASWPQPLWIEALECLVCGGCGSVGCETSYNVSRTFVWAESAGGVRSGEGGMFSHLKKSWMEFPFSFFFFYLDSLDFGGMV